MAEDVVGDVGVAGADEEVVGGLGDEEGFGVAEGGDGAEVEAVLGEDGADEGAEVGRAVDEEDAAAALLLGFCGGGGFLEGG